MKGIRYLSKFKKNRRLKSRLITGLSLLILSLIINHLTENNNFPFSDTYRFPLFSIIASIVIGTIVLIIADINFKYFKENYFNNKITSNNILHFLLSTMGYISIIYIPIYYFAVWIHDENFSFYYLLIGLLLTLLLSCLTIIFLFAKDIYKLHKLETLNGKIDFKYNGETHLINYRDVSYIFSESKIVYIVTISGETLITDFTLNQLEDKISEHLFFRANRQIILHYNSIEHFKPIENGKLIVTLKSFLEKDIPQITISRYKKKDFEAWFNKKLQN